jgi:hypothetical protein
MRDPDAPSGAEAAVAYALSAAGTMLWVGCVIPAGRLAEGGVFDDRATPMGRSAILLVPGLLLLILGPVSALIARGVNGRRGVLAATDTFVCMYASIAITLRGRGQGATFWALTSAMGVLGLLSLLETVRYARAGARGRAPPHIRGLRLALAILILLMPSWFLVEEGRELASLLSPFAFVALSAAGEKFSTSSRALRRVAAFQHLLVAAHLFIALRYTVFDGEPAFEKIGHAGYAVVAGSALLAGLALVQVAMFLRPAGRSEPALPATAAVA